MRSESLVVIPLRSVLGTPMTMNSSNKCCYCLGGEGLIDWIVLGGGSYYRLS
jgi:hypothetical protein